MDLSNKITFRQAIFKIMRDYPKVSVEGCMKALTELGYTGFTKEQVANIVSEAKFAHSTPVARYRDLAPDNLVYQINAEEKGRVKFGIIGDTHFGSKTHKRAELEKTVDIMLNEGVKTFLCPGDLLDGMNVYAGQTSHLALHTEEDQIQEAIEGLPKLPKGCKYYWISGNHDLIWLKKSSASDPLISMHNSRDDFFYLGKYSAYINLGGKVWTQMIHPMSGNSYAVGHAAQKFVDSLTAARRPDLLIFGHWHCPAHYVYKEVIMELNASFQGENDLSIRMGWPNVVGGKIIDFGLDKNGKIHRYKQEEILFWQNGLNTLNRTIL